MKSIKQQYIDLKEGRMSQFNFMRNLRMTLPQYVTNLTSFEDSVKILKNKGILTEAIGGDPVEATIKSYLSKGYSYSEAIEATAAEQGMDEEVLMSQYPQDTVDTEGYEDDEDDEFNDMIARAEEEEAGKYTKNYDFPGGLSEDDDEEEDGYPDGYEDPDMFDAYGMDASEGKINKSLDEVGGDGKYYASSQDRGVTGSEIEFSVVKNTPEYFTIAYKITPNSPFLSKASSKWAGKREVEEGDIVIKKNYSLSPYQRKWINVNGNSFGPLSDELVNMLYSDNLNEAKKKKKKKVEDIIDNPNQFHPQELRMGMKVELEHTDDLDVAKKIAMDHLRENPFYYTEMKLSGLDTEHTTVQKYTAPKKVKKVKQEMVDKDNQMTKVKLVKEAKFNAMPGEEPNAAVKHAIGFINSNPVLKAISDQITLQNDGDNAILKYGYWEALSDEAYNKLELQFTVEDDIETEEEESDKVSYILYPKKNQQVKDLGSSFNRFKATLEEIVREVLDETFDGRDNLDAENEY